MRQILKNKLLVFAAVAGLVTAFFVYQFLMKVASSADSGNRIVRVVVARQDIPIGDIIEPGMLQIRQTDKNNVPPSATENPSLVLGNVARNRIVRGNPILVDDIESKNRLSHVVPRNLRAVTVSLDPSRNVSGFLKPGDHVDVIATYDVDGSTVSKTVVQDAELLATGGQVLGQETSGARAVVNGGDQLTATMALTPPDTERLVLAESKGKISLALRRLDDSSLVVARGTTGEAVFGVTKPTPRPAVQVKQVPTPPVKAKVVSAPVVAQMPRKPEVIKSEPPRPAVPETKVMVVRGAKVEEVTVSE